MASLPRGNLFLVSLLQGYLGKLELDRHRIVAGEAGVAKASTGAADDFHETFDAEVTQRVGVDQRLNLFNAFVVGDKLAAGGYVDPQVAGVFDGGSAHPHVHFPGAGLAEQPNDVGSGGAANDAVVDDHQPLSLDYLGQGIKFLAHAQVAHLLLRLDECATDVAVLNQPFAIRYTGLTGITDGSGDGGVGYADNEVGVDGCSRASWAPSAWRTRWTSFPSS